MEPNLCQRNLLSLLALVLVSCSSNSESTLPSTASGAVVAEPRSEKQARASEKIASARPVEWAYTGDSGPMHWGSLSPLYAACGNGKSQSPINIVDPTGKAMPKLALEYKTTSLHMSHNEHVDDIIDNGHTIQINVEPGSTIRLNEKLFSLKQAHFHTPSEHTINGQRFPMEMHLVHQGEDGAFAVIGVLIKQGRHNPDYAKIVRHLPNAPGEDKHVPGMILDVTVYLPKNKDAYHYKGSLTTPPCSENVDWLVLREHVSLSAQQLQAFHSRLKNNNRPTQASNDRPISVDHM